MRLSVIRSTRSGWAASQAVSAAEAGVELVPGQAESAPHGFSVKRTAIRVTMVATVLFAVFYLNYVFGWVTPSMLDWTR